MSFMSPKAESPAFSSATAGRVSTYQEAESLPLGVGYMRVALKWITDRFNDHWSNGKTTGQAYCSIAGAIMHGPIDHVRAIFKAGDVEHAFYADRPTNPADPNYYYLSFSFGGPDAALGPTYIGRLYWGREDQPADAWLSNRTGQSHPPYRGIAYIVFERLHIGQITAGTQAKPSLPTFEVSVYRLPSEDVPTGLRIPSSVSTTMFRGVNPVAGLFELLWNKRGGMGLDARTLDTADWAAKAQAIENGSKPAGGASSFYVYYSPLLTGGVEGEKVVTDALSYLDGWLYSYSNKLRLDWFPNDGTVPAEITELSQHDMIDEPRVKTESLTESPSTIVVSCLDGGPGEGLDLVDAAETYTVPFVRELTGEANVKKLDRPWITNRDIAAGYAARYGRACTVPDMEGESIVRLDRAYRPDGAPLAPNDIVRINWAPSSLLVVARITEILEDDTAIKIRWKRERGMSSLPYVPAVDPRQGYVTPSPDVLSGTDWNIIDSPDWFGSSPSVIVLARRPSLGLLGLKVHLDEDGDWSSGSTFIGTQPFSAAGALVAGIGSGDSTLDITGTDPDLAPALGSGVSASDQSDNALLAIVDGEWCSVGTVTTLSAGTYRLTLLRGRLGSAAAAHSASARIWITRRDRLTVYTHAALIAGSTRYFKVQTYNASEDSSMSAAKSLAFRTRDLGATDVLVGQLTNESHALPAGSDGTVTSYAGATGSFVVTANGVNVTTSCAFSVLTADGSTSSINSSGVYSTTAVSKAVTSIVLRASYRGRTIDRVFSLSKALSGAPGVNPTTYRLGSLSPLKKSIAGIYTPTTVAVSAQSASGSSAPSAYSGRFKIEDTPDGTTWTTRYSSASDQSSYAWTPTAGITQFRVTLYQAGGLTVQLDQAVVPVVLDGAIGVTFTVPTTMFVRDPANNAITPANAQFPASSITAGVAASYSGRFLIEDSLDNGTSWTSRYTSSVDEATCTYTPTQASAITHYRVSLYAAGAMTYLLSRTTVALAVKGATGNPGTDSTSYRTLSTAASISKTLAGVLTPATLTFSAYSKTGGGAPASYAGRFIIAESTDGSAFTDKYTSASNESSKAYTPSTSAIKLLRCRTYLAGATTNLVDEYVIPVVTDGPRSPARLYRSIGSGSSWSDAEAVAALAAVGYVATTNDEVTEYNAAGTFAQTRVYNGSAWVPPGQVFDGSLLVNGSVTATSLAAISAWAKQFTIGTNGYFSCGQSAYNVGTGWWMDYNAGAPRMSLGIPGTAGFTYDASGFKVYGDSLSIGKFAINKTGGSNWGGNVTSMDWSKTSWGEATPISLGVYVNTGVLGNTEQGSLRLTYIYSGDLTNYVFGKMTLTGQSMRFDGGKAANSTVAYGSSYSLISYDATNTRLDLFDSVAVNVSAPLFQVKDRINLWSSANPKLDIQNTLKVTTANGAYNILSLDGGAMTLNTGLRVQPNAATLTNGAIVAQHFLDLGLATNSGMGAYYGFNIDITGRGFTQAPQYVGFSMTPDPNIEVFYDRFGSSSTTCRIMLYTRDGTNLNNTTHYLTAHVVQWG